jgi:hypothetical protein
MFAEMKRVEDIMELAHVLGVKDSSVGRFVVFIFQIT